MASRKLIIEVNAKEENIDHHSVNMKVEGDFSHMEVTALLEIVKTAWVNHYFAPKKEEQKGETNNDLQGSI